MRGSSAGGSIFAVQGDLTYHGDERPTAEGVLHRWPLPLVSDVDPYRDLGVFRSAIAARYLGEHGRPPYIQRDIDVELDDALRTAPFVLLVGPSKAGKSRTAFEACRRVCPVHALIIPRNAEGLKALPRLEPPIELASGSGLLWLDDLERFLEAGALDATQLDRWERHDSGMLIVATLRETEFERLQSGSSEISRQTRLVLDRAKTIRLSGEADAQETADASAMYPGVIFESGIGEQLAASTVLVQRFLQGRGVKPSGVAIARAAIDWKRCGMDRPITEVELQELYAGYLRRARPNALATNGEFQDGLRWALKPVESSAALVNRTDLNGARAYRAFDYLVDYADQPDNDLDPSTRTVPEDTWTFTLLRSTPAEATVVGYVAYVRGSHTTAEFAWRQAAAAGDAVAGYNLGLLLADRGDVEGAEIFWRQAAGAGDIDAAHSLGLLLAHRGDLEGAEDFCRQAAGAGHASAAYRLGVLLNSRGDIEGAEDLWRQAAGMGHDGAAYVVGRVLEFRGELEEAEDFYRQAAAAGVASAANNLGVLLQGRGELREAETFWRQAAVSDHAEVAYAARRSLALLGSSEAG